MGHSLLWLWGYTKNKISSKIVNAVDKEQKKLSYSLKKQLGRGMVKLSSVPKQKKSNTHDDPRRRKHKPKFPNLKFDINNILGSVRNLVEQFKMNAGQCSNPETRRDCYKNAKQIKCKRCNGKGVGKTYDENKDKHCYHCGGTGGVCSLCSYQTGKYTPMPWSGILTVDFEHHKCLTKVLRNLLEPLVGFKRRRIVLEDCQKCNKGKVKGGRTCPTCDGDKKLCNKTNDGINSCRWSKCENHSVKDLPGWKECTIRNGKDQGEKYYVSPSGEWQWEKPSMVRKCYECDGKGWLETCAECKGKGYKCQKNSDGTFETDTKPRVGDKATVPGISGVGTVTEVKYKYLVKDKYWIYFDADGESGFDDEISCAIGEFSVLHTPTLNSLKDIVGIVIKWINELPADGAVDLRNAVVDMIVNIMPAMGWGAWAKSWGLTFIGCVWTNKKVSMLMDGLTKEINSQIEKIFGSLVTQVEQLQQDAPDRRRLTATGHYTNGTFTSELSRLMQEIEDSKRD